MFCHLKIENYFKKVAFGQLSFFLFFALLVVVFLYVALDSEALFLFDISLEHIYLFFLVLSVDFVIFPTYLKNISFTSRLKLLKLSMVSTFLLHFLVLDYTHKMITKRRSHFCIKNDFPKIQQNQKSVPILSQYFKINMF